MWFFFPEYSNVRDNCLIGIYHSNSWQSSKDRVLNQFEGAGVKRVIIATTAPCMGVNFPDVRYIINWGPARSILDQHQEIGRAGRDGKKSHVVVIVHGQQVGHCEQEVKDFAHAKGSFRVAAYKTLDASSQPLEPLHACCFFCSTICKCVVRVVVRLFCHLRLMIQMWRTMLLHLILRRRSHPGTELH